MQGQGWGEMSEEFALGIKLDNIKKHTSQDKTNKMQ
jgi:hypothetical protein